MNDSWMIPVHSSGQGREGRTDPSTLYIRSGPGPAMTISCESVDLGSHVSNHWKRIARLSPAALDVTVQAQLCMGLHGQAVDVHARGAISGTGPAWAIRCDDHIARPGAKIDQCLPL
jgi:hypothetical protein